MTNENRICSARACVYAGTWHDFEKCNWVARVSISVHFEEAKRRSFLGFAAAVYLPMLVRRSAHGSRPGPVQAPEAACCCWSARSAKLNDSIAPTRWRDSFAERAFEFAPTSNYSLEKLASDWMKFVRFWVGRLKQIEEKETEREREREKGR